MRRKPQPPDPRTADMFDSNWLLECPPSSFMFDATQVIGLYLDIPEYEELRKVVRMRNRYLVDWSGTLLTAQLPAIAPAVTQRFQFCNISQAEPRIAALIQALTAAPILVIGIDWWNGEPWRVERAKLVLCS